MDIVADLLAFIAVNLVFAAFEIALNQVAEEAMQLDSGMVRAGQTTAAQTTGRQAEIPAILLHHDVAGDFGSAEKGVLGLVDGKALGNAMLELRVGVVPALVQFLQGDGIRPIPIDLEWKRPWQ